jgi:hypothetical protein
MRVSLTRKEGDRLKGIAPQSNPPVTDGRGFRAWDTRRANAFLRALNYLTQLSASLDELRLAAHHVSEHIAVRLPEITGELPRGYTVATNRDGERSLAHGGVLFSPSLIEPLPDQAAIERLAHDLSTGWLRDVADRLEIPQEFYVGAK